MTLQAHYLIRAQRKAVTTSHNNNWRSQQLRDLLGAKDLDWVHRRSPAGGDVAGHER
jgi:hypothetical protein